MHMAVIDVDAHYCNSIMKLFNKVLFYLFPDHPHILLELAIHGNLRDFLRNPRPLRINFWADK